MRERIKELERKQELSIKESVELWGLYDDWTDYVDNVVFPQKKEKVIQKATQKVTQKVFRSLSGLSSA